MQRSVWLVLLGVAAGCGGPSKPASVAPRVTLVEAPKPTPEKAPPPEPRPLPVVAMELKMHASHAAASVGHIRARRLDEKLIASKLAAPWRARFEAAQAATLKLEKAQKPVAEAYYQVLSCEADRCDAVGAKHEKLRATFDKESDRIGRAQDKTVAAFEKQLEKAPSVELALALAVLHDEGSLQSDIATMNHPAQSGFDYGEFASSSERGSSPLAILALERAQQLSEPATELGLVARYSLMAHHWTGGDAEAVAAALVSLLAHAPPEQRFELHARHALVLGAKGEHVQAAQALGRALDQPETRDEPVSRAQLRSARVVAEYRAGRFREALSLALTELDRGRTGASRYALLGDSSPSLRLAADCVERLGINIESLSAKPETQAQLLSQLALRALHRHDQKAAAEDAKRAVALSAKNAADGFAVLIALAKRRGDAAGAQELEEQKKRAGAYANFSALGGMGLLAVLGGQSPSPEHDERKSLDEDAKSDGKRNVASLFRLCLEPSFWKLPERGGKQAVDLTATLKDDGSISVEVSGDAPAEVSECLRSMGPKVLARAPSSIEARVDLARARQIESIWGDSAGVAGVLGGSGIGEAFGAGGLGLRGTGSGGGGTGEGTIGLGSLGTRGSGGGVGRGYGGIGRPEAATKPAKTKLTPAGAKPSAAQAKPTPVKPTPPKPSAPP